VAVVSPNEFWLQLHRLAEAYDAEGLTPEERGINIVDQYLQMPTITRRQVHADLLRIAVHIPELATLVTAAESQADDQFVGMPRLQSA
jgi:hypothetical protein